MTMFEFSVIASGPDPRSEDFESLFYDAGCDDALVAFQKGRIILDFAREAATLEGAVDSAIADVRRAGARVDHVEPDPLVSMADIADRSGLTRAVISLYAKGERGTDFPPPVACVTTKSPLWHWPDVAGWLVGRGRLEPELWAQAVTLSKVNESLASARATKEREVA